MSGRPKGASRGGKKPAAKGNQSSANLASGSGQTRPDNPLDTSAKEDKIIVEGNALAIRKKLPVDQPPCRPAFGTQGRGAIVKTNHAIIDIASTLKVRQYSISVKPEGKAKSKQEEKAADEETQSLDDEAKGRTRKEAIREFLKQCKADAVENKKPELGAFVTDFGGTLFNPHDVEVFAGGEKVQQIMLWGKALTVTVKYIKTLRLEHLFEYISSFGPYDKEEKEAALQMLNIWLRHNSKANEDLVVYGSKAFPLRSGGAWTECYLGDGLTAMRGVFASIRPATGRILANIQVTQGAFFTSALNQHGDPRHPAGSLLPLMTAHKDNLFKLDNVLKLLKVEATHLRPRTDGKRRFKTIIGLAKKDDGAGLPAAERGRFRANKTIGFGAREVEFQYSAAGQPPTMISVYDYFRDKYPAVRIDPALPLLNIGTRDKPGYMPAEVLSVKEGQFARMELPVQQAQNMIDFAVRRPDETYERVSQGRRLIGHEPPDPRQKEQMADPFGRVGDLITVTGRFMPLLKVSYAGQEVEFGKQNYAPTWDLKKKTMTRCAKIADWSIALVTVAGERVTADKPPTERDFWRPILWELGDKLKGDGVTTRERPLKIADWQLTTEEDPSLEAKMREFACPVNQGLRPGELAKLHHLVVIMFTRSTTAFHHIKRHGDVVLGIPTICLQAKKLEKAGGRAQYLANVLLKVNLKGGGVNQKLPTTDHRPAQPGRSQPKPTLPMGGMGVKLPYRGGKPTGSQPPAGGQPKPNNEPFFKPFNGESTMIVGIDVTHPSPGDNPTAPSVAGMVASMDDQLGQWPAILCVQKGKEEMVAELGKMLETRLSIWGERHRRYPANILIYRDGVSESQYEQVIEQEYPQLRKVCRERYATRGVPEPRITIVVAGKRHHVRFYPKEASDADANGNTRAGLVVDRGITEARSWDFYLQAHAAIKGTVRPVHYYVVHDDIFSHYHRDDLASRANELENVTYQLSYLFGRATLAVSLCTPVYYAHLACERARGFLHHLYSQRSGGDSGGVLDSMQKAVTLHRNVRDTMFYI